ncbi:putative arsenite methyltransferase [Hypoxylon sp. FL0890]|nr:putative arsenite methyltransferase [Hypoxylon sp. FL0890]
MATSLYPTRNASELRPTNPSSVYHPRISCILPNQRLSNTMGNQPKTNYTQGHSPAVTSGHASRTVNSDAAFLVPYLKPTDRILDVGCGPGTITVGLAAYVPRGSVVGIDLSADIVARAASLLSTLVTEKKKEGEGGERAEEEKERAATELKARVSFEVADVLRGLAFEDASFDVVYASQLFAHMPPPDLPARALAEMRRVLKPGGILATRDAAAQHFFPRALDLDVLLSRNLVRGFGRTDWAGPEMPALYRAVGFDADGGKVRVGCGTTCYADPESRRWRADGLVGRLAEGEAVRESWIRNGVSEEEITTCVARLREWADTPDAWYCVLQMEIIAWK